MHFMLGCSHFLASEQRCQSHGGAGTCRRHCCIMGHEAAHHELRAVLGINALNMTQTSRHRHNINRRISTANTNHFVGTDLQAPGVECFQELHTTDAVGCIGTGYREWPS